jgi:hypothetical protein
VGPELARCVHNFLCEEAPEPTLEVGRLLTFFEIFLSVPKVYGIWITHGPTCSIQAPMDEKSNGIESKEPKESIDVPGYSGDIDGLVSLLPSKGTHSKKKHPEK